MIRHVWSVLCGNSSIDHQTSIISLLNVIEQLNLVIPKQLEHINVPVPFEVVSLWASDSITSLEQGKCRVTFVNPQGVQTILSLADIKVSAEQNCRTITRSQMFKLDGQGKYEFIVELQQGENESWDSVAKVPLQVKYTIDKKEIDESSTY